MKTSKYLAIIGDIVDSKQISNREQVQNKLNKVLETINLQHEDVIASKFVLTLGDEFQGLLLNMNQLLEIIDFIYFEMYPIKIRIGVGIGEITTDIKPEIALGADGPAYYEARNAVNYIHANERKNATHQTSIAIFPCEKLEMRLINLSLSQYSSIFNDWDDKVYQTVSLMEKKNNQSEVSKVLKISQGAVTKRLKTAQYYNFRHIRSELNEIMNEVNIHEC